MLVFSVYLWSIYSKNKYSGNCFILDKMKYPMHSPRSSAYFLSECALKLVLKSSFIFDIFSLICMETSFI